MPRWVATRRLINRMEGVINASWSLFTIVDGALLRVGDLVGDLLDDDEEGSVGRRTRPGGTSTNGFALSEMRSLETCLQRDN